MKINKKEVKAIIFDLDGTLVDSTFVWSIIDKEFFAMHNLKVPKDYSRKIAHTSLNEAAIYTKETYKIEESVECIIKTWNDMVKEKYEKEIKLKKYALEFIKKAKANGLKIALATANIKELYEPCLKRLGIYDYFDFIADVSSVNANKNDVKLYDYVLAHLGSKKEETAVFEDISVGLKTAHSNGYIAVAISDLKSRKDFINKYKYSDAYIFSYKQLLKKF